jgi:general secretion pathway protein L
MAMIDELKQLFGEWITAVTHAVDAAAARLVRSRRILLEEREDGTLTAKAIAVKNRPTLPEVSFQLDGDRPDPPLTADWAAAFRGGRVEAQLHSGRVMVSRLDFPSQAGHFLDGMIRAQIDRLTPWTVKDAVFGWTPPIVGETERIEVTLATTSKLAVQPLLQFIRASGAASVALHGTAAFGASPPVQIKLLDNPLQSSLGSKISIPRLLRTILLATGAVAAASLLVASYLDNSLQSEQGDLQRRISQRRASLRLDPNAPGSGLGLLAKRKQTTPSSVMVLEAVSRALPDTTYVTELRIEGDKVQVVGMTQDAPSLVRLMEQSPQFTRATFFAPTTRAANEPGERFHIEAHITAYFGSGT